MLDIFRRRARNFLKLLPLRVPVADAAGPALGKVLRAHNRHVLSQLPPVTRWSLLGASFVLWPFWSVRLAWRSVRARGRRVRALGGPTVIRQFFEVWRFANRHGQRPYDYYYFKHWRAGTPSPSQYFTDGPVQRFFSFLNQGVDTTVLDDKQRFHDFCIARDLPTPPLLARFENGRGDEPGDPATLECDLFCKLQRGWGARDATRWCFDPHARVYRRGPAEPAFAWPALRNWYKQKSARGAAFVIQPRLRNHPAIDDLANDALCTVRIVTVFSAESGAVEMTSMFNLPTGRAITNNLADGAVACPIHAATGTLRPGFTRSAEGSILTHHPSSGIPISGRVLPDWKKAVDLACAAHAALMRPAVIGWDVALTPEGPLLLEGNHQIALNFHQLPPNPPFAHSPLAAWLEEHLDRSPAG